jgi:hypothetical protein
MFEPTFLILKLKKPKMAQKMEKASMNLELE